MTVMIIGRCHGGAPDKPVFGVDADTVLVNVVIDAVLFDSASI